MEHNARAGPSSDSSVSLDSSGSQIHEDAFSDEEDMNAAGSGYEAETDAEENANGGYEELHAELNGSAREDKGKGVARSQESSIKDHSVPKTPKPKSGSWSELDLSLVVALVSPIGNWLTGSDHIKNLLLIAFLIFYLHQLIEVPWQLYHASRPRRSPRRARTASGSSDTSNASNQAIELAASELHTQELFYLSLTVISPLLGAYLIRYILTTLEGVDNLSWFSTTLFVLATGIRPWSHLIARLRHRTQALHDAVHYPSEDSAVRHQAHVDKKLHSILQRLETISEAVSDLQVKTAKLEPLREVCDDLSEGLGDVERSLLRHDRKVESVRVSQDMRLSALETSLVHLEERRRHGREILADRSALFPYGHEIGFYLYGLLSPLWKFIGILGSFILPYIPFLENTSKGTTQIHTNLANGPDARKGIKSPVLFTSRLETIPEAENSDSEGTYVSGDEPQQSMSPPPKALKTTIKRSRSGSRPGLRRQQSYGAKAFAFAYNAVAWPYRSAVGVLKMFVSPVQKLVL
ncbi:unnamed protein product [Somion occarium]|uniref:Uncharacterized protein n=1 Tax=Somion occarium TaxID=3059160 RepID=A0ABP1CPL0_9APHY